MTLASVRAGGGRRLPTPQHSHHACASTASLLLASGVPPECANNSSVLYMFCFSFVLFVCVLNQRGVVVVVVVLFDRDRDSSTSSTPPQPHELERYSL